VVGKGPCAPGIAWAGMRVGANERQEKLRQSQCTPKIAAIVNRGGARHKWRLCGIGERQNPRVLVLQDGSACVPEVLPKPRDSVAGIENASNFAQKCIGSK
jgi:hypothetical protein